MSDTVKTSADLDRLAKAGSATLYPGGLKILVGSATCGLAMGAQKVEDAAVATVKKFKADAVVKKTGCIGFCSREPLLDMVLPNGPRISFGNMTPEKTREVLSAYFTNGAVSPEAALGRFTGEDHVLTGESHAYGTIPAAQTIPEWSQLDFMRGQKRIIMRSCGSIDPMSIEEAIARGAYRGALKALTTMKPEQVIEEILASGLRGRGGAYFPTGQKWKFARNAKGDVKYIVCNADEGAPGSSMDRTVIEGDPHAVIEGMIVGSYAIGARQGFVYVRSEYPLAIAILEHAIDEAEKLGLLGKNIFGSGWSFSLSVRRGAGAYVCGEETGLIESIEGHAGEPRARPPFPVTAGLWGKPTVVNNVKTWASVAPILTRGAQWYASMGTKNTTGTTIYSLEGSVNNAGLVEVPFGITLREMIYGMGGGVRDGKACKAVQIGGPSVGCIPPSMLDLAIDSVDIPGKSANMGTGGIIVMDQDSCVVDMTRFLLGFFVDESCGRCTPCREGTKQMYGMLDDIASGRANADTIASLERLSRAMNATAVCGLGNTASGPVANALTHFRDEIDMHIAGRKCPAGVCSMKVKKDCHRGTENAEKTELEVGG
ncbi:MAG TPA: NADH-quinone oxidoreductase subunit NuoF [Chitinivibrionales bacterium]|nr:NADH-quinone oxidoreductase subunit NuoF [Chitinivibrionales bacterium]